MNHHIVAHIDAYMGDAFDICAHRFFEKNEIAGARVLLADIAAQGVEPIGAHPPYIAHAGVVKDPANIAGAVKAGIGIAGTVHIGIADVLLRFNHQGEEIGIGPKKLLRDGVVDQLVLRLHAMDFHVRFANRGNHGNVIVFNAHEILRVFQNHGFAIPVVHIKGA